MKLINQATDETILGELGARLAQARLDKNFTQAQLATQAGISKRTVERLESGMAGTELSAFIRVCRVLDLIGRLEALIPEAAPSPMAQLKSGGRKRRRASAVSTPPSAVNESAPASGTWTWGEKS
ncbi:MAG TPA: helix-turn-helix transcriptional regulator [Lacunisphaera sp.]|nr:helix-turn-helix transcriptional regulator [Lacunisphaera sp.]